MTHLARALGLFLALGLALAASAAVPFDIPAQSASSALKAFGKQAKVEVLFRSEEVKNVQTKALKGDLEPAQALDQLLVGSGLTARQTSPTNFVVAAPTPERPGSIEGAVREEKSGRPVAGAKVAIAGTDKQVLTDRRGRFTLDGVPSGDHVLMVLAEGMQDTKVTDVTVRAGHRLSLSAIGVPVKQEGPLNLEPYTVSAKKNDGVLELDPYAVEGSKPKPFTTANMDLMRTREDPLPFTTFSARDIEYSGAGNVEDFLRSRLTSMMPSYAEERRGDLASPTINANRFNLRGWGDLNLGNATESVILVNGRRLPTWNFGPSDEGTSSPGNIRGIPVGSIERVEILSSAAGAIYGAGATGGVINVITKSGWSGGQLSLSYETPLDAHAPKRSTDISYSIALRPNLSLRLHAGYSQSLPLSVGDRADVTVGRVRGLILQHVGDIPLVGRFGFQAPILAATSNFKVFTFSQPAPPLFGPDTATYSSVPPGYQGGQGLAPFLARQGVLNLELGAGVGRLGTHSLGRDVSFGSEVEDQNLGLATELTLNDRWRVTLEFQHRENTLSGDAGSPDVQVFTASANAPTNPFGLDIVGSLADPNFNRPELGSEINTRTDSVSLTLRGSVGEWQMLVDGHMSHDKNDMLTKRFIDLLPFSVEELVASGAYNPFVDPMAVLPTAASNYDEYQQRIFTGKSESTNWGFTAKVSGPLLKLPAGAWQFTAGLEWRRSDRDVSESTTRDINTRTQQLVGTITNSSPIQNLITSDEYALYSEVTVPVVSDRQGIHFAEKLEVIAAGRIGRHVRNGFRADRTPVEYKNSPHLWLAGLRYDVVPGIAMRVSRSHGFKPPSFRQVTPDLPPTNSTTVLDRRTGQTIVLAATQYSTGGHPDLLPESTRSTNLGLVVEPSRIRGLRLSIDYVENIREDAISSLSAGLVLDGEVASPVLAARVQRNSAGAVTFVDARNINFREISSKSIDFTLDQRFENVLGGRVVVSGAATRNYSFKVQASADTPVVDHIRNRSERAFRRSFVEWNANAQVRWESDRWVLGWGARFFDSVLVTPENYILHGSDRIPWEVEHDAFISRRFAARGPGDGWRGILGDSSISVGVRNVFGRDPRLDADYESAFAAFNNLGISAFDSVYGRSVWVQFRKDF